MPGLALAALLWLAAQYPTARLIGRMIGEMAGEYFDGIEGSPQ